MERFYKCRKCGHNIHKVGFWQCVFSFVHIDFLGLRWYKCPECGKRTWARYQKPKKMYDYLISFSCNREGYLTPCGGLVQLSRERKINSFVEYHLVLEYVTGQVKDAKNIVIENIMFLGRNKHLYL